MSHIYSDKVQLAIKLLGFVVFCRMTTYTSSDVVDVVSHWNESDSDWSSDENSNYQIDRLDAIQWIIRMKILTLTVILQQLSH